MPVAVVAVVLGGRGQKDELTDKAQQDRAQQEVAAKALVEVAGKPMAAYVLEALRASSVIDAVVYVGPTTPLIRAMADACVAQGEMVSGSVQNGLDRAKADYPQAARIMVITADLPWLTAEAVDDLVAHAPEAALVYPIVSKEVSEAQFPHHNRTYARLREGEFTGGNLFLLESSATGKLVPLIERFYAVRKRPLAAANMVGWGVLLKYVMGRLTVQDAEERIGKLAGVSVKAYRTAYASIGADVDKRSQLESISHLPLSGAQER